MAQQALAQVTYTVDRSVGTGRVTGTITTNGNIGVLTAADIVDWNLALDANGDGTTVPVPGRPIGVMTLQGTALSATATGLFWDFSTPTGFNILQFQPPPGTITVWQIQTMVPVFVDELINEAPDLQAYTPRPPGVEQIATTVIAPLEITADTTLTADRRGPVVIAADNVTLDCAHHSVTGNPKEIGIRAVGRIGVTIARCVVVGFGEGIVLEDSSQSVLTENTLSENATTGIRLTNADRNGLTGNYVTYTRGLHRFSNGLVLASSSRNRLEFNTVDHSDVAGILVDEDSQSNDLVANVSSFNGGAGFDVGAATSNSFLRNTAIRNGDFGFVLRGQAMRNKLLENSACLNSPADATEIRDGRRGNGNVWALNLFCSPSF